MKTGKPVKKKIAVFGGTFDPPHNGHIGLAKKTIELGYADGIVFVPAFHPPHKPLEPITDFQHRLEMLKIATAKFHGFEVSSIESERSNLPSYTYDTLLEFSRARPDSEIILLVGSDSLLSLHSWHNSAKLVKTWKILSYPRKNFTVSKESLLKYWDEKTVDSLMNSALEVPFYDISSTDIRKRLKRHEAVDELIDYAVYSYIRKHSLYKEEY